MSRYDNADLYQDDVERTMRQNFDSFAVSGGQLALLHYTLQNAAKTGREAERAKKHVFHGHPFPDCPESTLLDSGHVPGFHRLLTAEDFALINYAIGLFGEACEVVDMVLTHVFHRHGDAPIDRERLAKELGDNLWYNGALGKVLGVKLSDVMAQNIDKLKARYPAGFTSEASLNRKD